MQQLNQKIFKALEKSAQTFELQSALPTDRRRVLEFNYRLSNIQDAFWRKVKSEPPEQKLQSLATIIEMLEELDTDLRKILLKQPRKKV